MTDRTIRQAVTAAIADALERAQADGTLSPRTATEPPAWDVTRPDRADHGDFASNVALKLAGHFGRPPTTIAEELATRLPALANDGLVERAEPAGPGFLNLWLSAERVERAVDDIRRQGMDYGRVAAAEASHFNVEFVSANPTGPLTIGNARGAFVGDLLCRVLEAVGHRATREYYFNDAGAQVENLGLSVHAVRLGQPVPEDGYHGAYVEELAREVPDVTWQAALDEPARAGSILGDWAAARIRARIEASLERLGVHFDVWTSEQTLVDDGWVERGVARLRAAGHVYEQDGALWFRSTAFGDDKDRVITRSNGEPTYFAKDIG